MHSMIIIPSKCTGERTFRFWRVEYVPCRSKPHLHASCPCTDPILIIIIIFSAHLILTFAQNYIHPCDMNKSSMNISSSVLDRSRIQEAYTSEWKAKEMSTRISMYADWAYSNIYSSADLLVQALRGILLCQWLSCFWAHSTTLSAKQHQQRVRSEGGCGLDIEKSDEGNTLTHLPLVLVCRTGARIPDGKL